MVQLSLYLNDFFLVLTGVLMGYARRNSRRDNPPGFYNIPPPTPYRSLPDKVYSPPTPYRSLPDKVYSPPTPYRSISDKVYSPPTHLQEYTR